MTTVIEAVYENGVLKPLTDCELKDRQRYRMILHEVTPTSLLDMVELDPELKEEIKRRTTILPDGRKIIRLAGLFQADLSDIPDDQDLIAEALAELRRERNRRFDEKWPVPDEEAE